MVFEDGKAESDGILIFWRGMMANQKRGHDFGFLRLG